MALAATLAFTPAAKADSYVFSFDGGGLSASGVLTYSNAAVPGVPGAFQVTGISGTFSDTHAGISNAAITGLQTTGLPTGINANGTFVPPGTYPITGSPEGISYDNLFYPASDSPWVCPPPAAGDPNPLYPYHGGSLDIYGVLFSVDGGYVVDMWSNGVIYDPAHGLDIPLTFGARDALNGVALNAFGNPFSRTSVNLSTSPVPEPSSLFLMGTGLLGLAGGLRRKIKPFLGLGA
ncbi:MAG: PEP-CTERM sorting domain-containing protein [Edaphobacter sp.]